jgi:hypothetical protein
MATSGALSLALLVVFAAAYSYVAWKYVRALYKHHESFYLFIRVPELLHMEAAVNVFICKQGLAVCQGNL